MDSATWPCNNKVGSNTVMTNMLDSAEVRHVCGVWCVRCVCPVRCGRGEGMYMSYSITVTITLPRATVKGLYDHY